jgi:hypothetical protein
MGIISLFFSLQRYKFNLIYNIKTPNSPSPCPALGRPMGGPVLQLFFSCSSVFLRSFTEEIPKKHRRNTEEMRELAGSRRLFSENVVSLHLFFDGIK